MKKEQKDLLREEARANRETATKLGGGQPVADVADAIEAALKEVEALESIREWAEGQAALEREHRSPHNSPSAGYASAVGDVLALLPPETPNEPN